MSKSEQHAGEQSATIRTERTGDVIAQRTKIPIVLEPERRTLDVELFEAALREKIVGQDEAVAQLVNIYETVLACMTMPGRPIANLLFLGPTGSGKTRIVEAAAEILFGSPNAFVKIDCGEFQHSHEISKLVGSPPGYIGHRETPAVLNQNAIDQFQTDGLKMTFLLFDEIEKANDALWRLLLGVLDKGALTLGDNQKVDLSRVIVVMTSNLGAEEMYRFATGSIGFASGSIHESVEQTDKRIDSVAMSAAKRYFSPEFMNRLDKVIVFHVLTPVQLRGVLEIELTQLRKRIKSMRPQQPFRFDCTPETKEFLIREGTDTKYGARPLKRAIERYIVLPLARLLSTDQIVRGDKLTIDVAPGKPELVFRKEDLTAQPRQSPTNDSDQSWEPYVSAESRTVSRLLKS